MLRSKVRVLSICGGGIRGLIPAYILRELEQRLQKKLSDPNARLAQHVDFVTGTSIGGLMTTLLLTPGENGSPKYSAAAVFDKVHEIMLEITYVTPSGTPAPNAEYCTEHSKRVFEKTFDTLELKDLTKPCMLTAYDPNRNWLAFLKQHRAVLNPHDNFYVKDAVLSTCALPVYAEPAKVRSLSDRKITHDTFMDQVDTKPEVVGAIMAFLMSKQIIDAQGKILRKDIEKGHGLSDLKFPESLQRYSKIVCNILERVQNPEFTFLDGCMFANNPALCALIEAKKMDFPNRNIKYPSTEDIMLVSLGTGVRYPLEEYDGEINANFTTKLISMLFESAEDIVHFQCHYLYSILQCLDQYYQFDPLLHSEDKAKDPTALLNDVSEENITALLRIAEQYVENQSSELDRVVDGLLQ